MIHVEYNCPLGTTKPQNPMYVHYYVNFTFEKIIRVCTQNFFLPQSACFQSVGPLVMPSLCSTLKIILHMQLIQAEKENIQMIPSTHVKALISQGLLKHGFWFTNFHLGKEENPMKVLGEAHWALAEVHCYYWLN